MTIDERLEALTVSAVRLHANHEEMQGDISALLRAQVLMTESFQKLAGSMGTLTGRMETLTGRVEELAEAQLHTDKRVSATAEAQRQADQRLSSAMAELAEASRHADLRMDALILTVDEIIRRPKQ